MNKRGKLRIGARVFHQYFCSKDHPTAQSTTHMPTGPKWVTCGAFPPPRGAPGCVWQHGWCLSAITGSTAPPCSATFPPGHCSPGHGWRSRSTDRRNTSLLNPSKRARTPAPTMDLNRRLSCRRGCSSPPCRSLEDTFVISVMPTPRRGGNAPKGLRRCVLAECRGAWPDGRAVVLPSHPASTA